MLVLYLVLQLPVIIWALVTSSEHFIRSVIAFEFVILGSICLWQFKPRSEMDERELQIELKWKDRMLEFTYPCILLPIVTLSIYPATDGWRVLMLFGIPVFIIFCVLSVLLKRDLGGFFYRH